MPAKLKNTENGGLNWLSAIVKLERTQMLRSLLLSSFEIDVVSSF